MKQGFQIVYFVYGPVGFDDTMVKDNNTVAHLAHFLHDMGG